MPEVRNTSRGDLTMVPGGLVPAGGSISIDADALDRARRIPVVRGWFDSGKLVVVEQEQVIVSVAPSDEFEARVEAVGKQEAPKVVDREPNPANLDALKARARALGVSFGGRIGAETLAERIAEAEAAAAARGGE